MDAMLTPPPSCDEQRPYRPTGNNYRVWESRAFELLVDGPAGTGKTRGLCELSWVAAAKYAGCRIGWAMQQRVDMTETVLQTFEDEVVPAGHSVLRGPSRAHRSKYTLTNGSEIVLVGLDEVQRTRGLQLDWVLEFEATNIRLQDHEMLIRCLRHGVIPHARMICDTNPGGPAHWLLDRVRSGKMHRISITHKDNPRYWDADANDWTPEGRAYVLDRLSHFTGVLYKRMVEGLWVAEEGSVFDGDLLAGLLDQCQEPCAYGRFEFTLDGPLIDTDLKAGAPNAVRWIETSEEMAQCKLWLPVMPNGRLHQSMSPVACADVSWGQGASNSVICAADRNTGRKILEFASGTLPPEQFARLLVGIGYWLGGSFGNALIGWEANGPGMSVAKIACDVLNYPSVYRDVKTNTGRDKKTQDVGLWMDRQRKIDLAIGYQDALRSGRYVNLSKWALDEATRWIRYPSGAIGPASLERESEDARSTHGDRCVADMLLVHALEQAPLVQMKPVKPPWGSVAHDIQEMEREKEREDEW